jgi:hypothetical protein
MGVGMQSCGVDDCEEAAPFEKRRVEDGGRGEEEEEEEDGGGALASGGCFERRADMAIPADSTRDKTNFLYLYVAGVVHPFLPKGRKSACVCMCWFEPHHRLIRRLDSLSDHHLATEKPL